MVPAADRFHMSTRAFPAALLSPAVARNRDPILAVLRRHLPAQGTLLEIASGTGEHAAYFAPHFPHLAWQPTDIDPDALASIEAHHAAANAPNLRAPIALDVTAPVWPVTRADAILSINMIHISPWAAAQGLMAGAARLLPADGVLYLYGPFKENGEHTAPSNAAFDASLRARDPRWGVRDVGDVRALADEQGFGFVERVAMPANNLSLVFRRR
jgi:cyclopropane fatty-acyl-phospholipid synthase-like methyltransferase